MSDFNRQFDSPSANIGIYNESAESIPAHSIVKVTGARKVTDPEDSNDFIYLIDVTKPDDDEGRYYIVEHLKVPATQYGVAVTAALPTWVKYHGLTPVIGDKVGPDDDSWTVHTDSDNPKFEVLEVLTSDSMVLVQSLGGSATKKCPTWLFLDTEGIVTGGSFDIHPDINIAGSYTVTVNWDDTAQDVVDKLIALHVDITEDVVEAGSGVLPYNIITIKFPNNNLSSCDSTPLDNNLEPDGSTRQRVWIQNG